MEELRLIHTARYRNGLFEVNGEARSAVHDDIDNGLTTAWTTLGANYDRFYRADGISKLTLLCGEALLSGVAKDEGLKERTGMVIMGRHGSLDTDVRYHKGLIEQNLASPGLFVYTLPNIAMGELSIRHGLHGTGICLLANAPDTDRLRQVCASMLTEEGMSRVICGWADIFAGAASATFMLVGKEGRPWNTNEVNALYT